MSLNFNAAWIGILLGCISGMVTGLFFHRADWLGGYASWERRMIRLGHISFFGIGLINLGFALSTRPPASTEGLAAASALLIVAAIGMPSICYLSAWRKPFRSLFFIPALSLATGIGLFLARLFNG